MRSIVRYIAIVVFLAASSLFLFGCSENAQTKAITDAVVAYTDYYIEVRNLSDQVREQSTKTDTSAKSVDYVINVEIPDYTKIDMNQTGFILPEPSVSTRSASSYEQQATLALRQAMERYVMQNGTDVAQLAVRKSLHEITFVEVVRNITVGQIAALVAVSQVVYRNNVALAAIIECLYQVAADKTRSPGHDDAHPGPPADA